ncbi:MAG TPA: TRAP transporter large permease subunit [Burkholderiales bacterium]
MSAVLAAHAMPVAPASGALRRLENGALAAVFAITIALPLVEMALRASLGVGIQGIGALVQHATLLLGMLGAAAAARDGRLLTLAVSGFIKGRAAEAAHLAGRAIAAAVAFLLLWSSIEFVAAEYRGGAKLVYSVPTWVAQLPLPLGYGLIGLRLLRQASPRWQGQLGAALFVAALVAWLKLAAPDAAAVAVPAVVVLLAAALLGAPLFALIGGAALFLLVSQGVPAAAVAVDHYSLVVNPSLPAIPMFTLAGYLLAESGAPRRLIEVFDALFGRFRGGAAVATVLACTFFTSFTGASGVTVLALGGLAMPLLLSTGYRERNALGLVTAAGLPGTLLMPALPLILYAIIAGVSIEAMFLAGALPALLMAAIVAAYGVWRQPARVGPAPKFDGIRVRKALADAKWELSVPVVPIAALSSGLATPMESAALTALYVLFVTAVVHRDLHITRDVPRVMAECGLIIGGILLIMGLALGLTDYLVDAEVPARLVAWAKESIGSRIAFLLALNLVLLLAGCVIEIYPAIMVLVPIVSHVGAAFGIDPLHLGIIFLANMELGYLTPLVGLNLFFASYRFGKPVGEVFRAVLPLFCALALGVLLITYIPWLSTFLPALRG